MKGLAAQHAAAEQLLRPRIVQETPHAIQQVSRAAENTTPWPAWHGTKQNAPRSDWPCQTCKNAAATFSPPQPQAKPLLLPLSPERLPASPGLFEPGLQLPEPNIGWAMIDLMFVSFHGIPLGVIAWTLRSTKQSSPFGALSSAFGLFGFWCMWGLPLGECKTLHTIQCPGARALQRRPS